MTDNERRRRKTLRQFRSIGATHEQAWDLIERTLRTEVAAGRMRPSEAAMSGADWLAAIGRVWRVK